MKEIRPNLFSESLIESIVYAFLFACGAGLLVEFVSIPFITVFDKLVTFFDPKALEFVYDHYEPFRVSLGAGFLGSFITFIFLMVLERFQNKKQS